MSAAEIGDWAWDVPDAPHSQAVRTRALDEIVTGLRGDPGRWQLVDLALGRGSGSGSSLRARGCKVKTRHLREEGKTQVWAMWPETPR